MVQYYHIEAQNAKFKMKNLEKCETVVDRWTNTPEGFVVGRGAVSFVFFETIAREVFR